MTAAVTLSRTELRDLVLRFTEAFNRDDLDAVMAYFADDAIYGTFDGVDAWGKPAIRAAFEPQFRGDFGRIRFHEEDLFVDESTGKAVNYTYPHAWRYRDYVIAAFNADTPYGRFVTEQIAALVRVAREESDLVGEQFLHWFLQEQREEVASMSALLAIVERAADNVLLVEEYLARESGGASPLESGAPPAAGGTL